MALPVIIDRWENDIEEPIDYTSDLVRKMYDTLKGLITKGDEITGEPDSDNSDVPIPAFVLNGYCGWSSNPRLVGSNYALEDQNIYFYSKFKCGLSSDNYLSDFVYVGGTNHFTEFGNPFPDATQTSIINSIQNNEMNMFISLRPELLNISKALYLQHDSGYDFLYCNYDNNGVSGNTFYTVSTDFNYNNSDHAASSNTCQIVFGSAEYQTGTDYWGAQTIVQPFSNSYVDGQSWLNVINFFTNMPCVIINPTADTNTINQINNVFNNNNVNNYNNTYNYDNETYNYYYGDNYINIYYPDDSTGLPFNDVRNIFNDALENLNIDVTLPTYTDIKYGDQGSFYITPVKQLKPLPTAPDIGDTVPDIGDYLSVVGGAVTSFYNMVDDLGIGIMLVFTFLICLVINHLKKE